MIRPNCEQLTALFLRAYPNACTNDERLPSWKARTFTFGFSSIKFSPRSWQSQNWTIFAWTLVDGAESGKTGSMPSPWDEFALKKEEEVIRYNFQLHARNCWARKITGAVSCIKMSMAGESLNSCDAHRSKYLDVTELQTNLRYWRMAWRLCRHAQFPENYRCGTWGASLKSRSSLWGISSKSIERISRSFLPVRWAANMPKLYKL